MSPAGNRRRAITLLTGLSIAALLTTLDISIGSSLVLVGLVVFAPLVVALFGDPRDVALVGAASIAAVAASGIWNDNFGDGVYVQRILVCIAVTVIAVLAARNRTRTARDRGRFAVLSATAEIADGTRSLEDTISSLHDLLVPAIADVCIVDAVSGGEVRRLAVRASGAMRDQIAATLASRRPIDPEQRQHRRSSRSSPSASATSCCARSPRTTPTSSGCAACRSARRSSCRCAHAGAAWER